MDLLKQTYLSVVELSNKIKYRADYINTLRFSDTGAGGIYRMRFSAERGQGALTVEAEQPIKMLILLDGKLIYAGSDRVIDARYEIGNATHELTVTYPESYTGSLKFTLSGKEILRRDKYSYVCYDEVNDTVYLTDERGSAYSLNNSEENPVLTHSGSPVSGVLYFSNGVYYPAMATVFDGELIVTDCGNINMPDSDVSCAVILNALSGDYHYSVYYIKGNLIKRIVKDAGGFRTIESVDALPSVKLASTGGNTLFFMSEKGVWNALTESISGGGIVTTLTALNCYAAPACNQGQVYVPVNGVFSDMNGREITNADTLFFIKGKAYLLWNRKITKLNEEDILW
jgi:hypothetical protein